MGYYSIHHVHVHALAVLSGLSIAIQAYLGYYVTLNLRSFTPGPIQGISSQGGYYVALRCLPLNNIMDTIGGNTSKVSVRRSIGGNRHVQLHAPTMFNVVKDLECLQISTSLGVAGLTP
jgi:hypothetical protein